MQIELIGCTSAGKSTLKSSIVEACTERQLAIWGDKEFVLEQFGLNWVKIDLLRTMLVDGVALIACMVTIKRNLMFYRFTRRVLRQLPLSIFDKFYILRNVLRKLGKYEIIRSYGTEEQIILVDEGVLQVAHNLFVHVTDQTAEAALYSLATFVRLAPQPDVIIYLRQPAALLIDRIMQRGHKRIVERTYENVERFVEQAVSTFDKLAENPALKPKLLVIDNGQEVIPPANDEAKSRFNQILQILHDSIGKMKTSAAVDTVGGNRFVERAQTSPVIQANGG